MEKEKVNYDLASHAVNIIENSQKTTSIPQAKIFLKAESEDYQLEGRRLPVKRKSVLVRNYYFIEWLQMIFRFYLSL